jgi:hypothetical protein
MTWRAARVRHAVIAASRPCLHAQPRQRLQLRPGGPAGGHRCGRGAARGAARGRHHQRAKGAVRLRRVGHARQRRAMMAVVAALRAALRACDGCRGYST